MRIGIDVGGTNLKAGLVDEEGNILTVCRTPVGRFTDGQDFAKVLAELALKAAAQGGVRPGKITGVGIGIPGAVGVNVLPHQLSGFPVQAGQPGDVFIPRFRCDLHLPSPSAPVGPAPAVPVP